MSETKIRVRVGDTEVEYEGDASYLKEGLPKLLKEMMSSKEPVSTELKGSPKGDDGRRKDPGGAAIDLKGMTVASICKKLDAKSGPDVACGAAAYLQFVRNTDTYSRKELSDNMKLATGYYKSSHFNNLTTSLERLVKEDALRETHGKYTLSATKRDELKAVLSK